mmetsp:Transcript_38331/g.105589  ORF Transcript_38331/g.105589 Transcript_38331/m.105589 type:complete len:170 (-) Transcript_38331:118-627(-)
MDWVKHQPSVVVSLGLVSWVGFPHIGEWLGAYVSLPFHEFCGPHPHGENGVVLGQAETPMTSTAADVDMTLGCSLLPLVLLILQCVLVITWETTKTTPTIDVAVLKSVDPRVLKRRSKYLQALRRRRNSPPALTPIQECDASLGSCSESEADSSDGEGKIHIMPTQVAR